MAGYSYGYGQWPLPQAQPPPPAFQPPQPPAQQLQQLQQSQQPFAPFSYPPASNSPPVYGTANPYQAAPQYPPQPYAQPPLPNPNYYAASQAAFDYNAHVAPSGTNTAAWNHGSVSALAPPQSSPKEQEIPASGSFQELFQSSRASPRPRQQESESSYQPSPAPPAPRQLLSAPASLQRKDAEEGELEEGELSEDYDAMYDPQTVSTSAPPLGEDDAASNSAQPQRPDESEEESKRASLESPVAIYGAGVTGEPPSRDASVIDPQDDAFYDEDDDDAPGTAATNGLGQSGADAADVEADDEYMGFSDSEQRTPPPGPSEDHRAESYSPHLSPQVTRPALPAESTKTDKTDKTDKTVKVPAEKAAVDAEKLANGSSGKAEHASSTSSLPFTSVEEAKKEAQRAILRLLPYGVNYQTFIDEGFEEKTIKALFSELGLKAAQTPAAEPSPQTSPKPVPAAASQTSTGDAAGPKPEERKDRIARLLALKASKPAAAPVVPVVPVAPAAPVAPATPTVEKTKADKTKSEKARLLQQKLDALKRQQAATQPPSRASPTATSEKAVLSHPLPPQPPAAVAPLADISANTNTLPLRDPKSTLPPRPVLVMPPAPGPPSASTSTPATPPVSVLGNSRKRPVAADLNDFSSSAVPNNPLKRPFGQTRQESSLIIDVSEDSDDSDGDDDDDVEMEVDSPEEETPAKVLPLGGGGRSRSGNSFHDVPPLSDTPSAFHPPSRPFGRPGTTSMVTPPTGPAATRAKDDEYARKMRQIEEMKRKIAEAEAKKARNTPSGSQTPQTPQTGNSTPEADATRRVVAAGDALRGVVAAAAAAEETPEVVSLRLPKRSDSVAASASSHESRHEIRARIASHQLPRVEATLQEKMFKLKLLQDKMAALQTEIDAGMEEKIRLTDQMSELEKESEPESEPEPVAAEPEKPAAITVSPSPEPMQVEEASIVEHEPVPDPAQVKAAEVAEAMDASPDEQMAEVAEESGSEYEPMEDVAEVEQEEDDDDDDEDDEDDDDEDDDDDDDEDEDEDEDEDDDAEEPLPEPAALVDPSLEQVQSNGPAGAAEAPTPTPTAAAAPTAPSKPTLERYESPLKYFRSYRFHPQYKASVAGGLKSLTYSGRIDPDVELCPRELSGFGCTDQTCRFQHFGSMVPQDDQILVELGRSDDFTGEQKAQFVTGLRDVLKRFRENQVCDFDKIAYEIIAFRRQFLGDASKVVSHLEDVTV